MDQLLCHLVGDFILQSDWMAQNKTKQSWPAFVHALLYSLCFAPLLWVAGYWQQATLPTTLAAPTAPVGYNCWYTAAVATAATTVTTPQTAGYWCVYLSGAAAETTIPKFIGGYFRWFPWLVIFGTHFLIDRFRVARYVVWAKNWIGPKKFWYKHGAGAATVWTDDVEFIKEYKGPNFKADDYYIWYAPVPPLWACPTGYPPTVPIWLSTWLTIIADQTLHLTINYLALRYL